MTWEFCLVSKPNFSEIRSLVERYHTRLNRSVKIEEKLFKDEGRLQAHIKKNRGLLIVLDGRGQTIDSIHLSKKIALWRESGVDTIRFCVGDAYGFSDEFREEADWIWKLSDLTLPGDFAWLLLWEQIFRGFAILNKTGYHHG